MYFREACAEEEAEVEDVEGVRHKFRNRTKTNVENLNHLDYTPRSDHVWRTKCAVASTPT